MHSKHDARYHVWCMLYYSEGTVYSRWMVLHHKRVEYAMLGLSTVVRLHVTKTLGQSSTVCSEFLSNSHYQENQTLLQTNQIGERVGQFVILDSVTGIILLSRFVVSKSPQSHSTEYD